MRATGARVKLEVELRARPEDLVRAEYVDPDGEPAFCHNTEVADAVVVVWNRQAPWARFRQACRLTSRATAHFEYAARSPDGRVERRHEHIG